jgi:hypothetical protein
MMVKRLINRLNLALVLLLWVLSSLVSANEADPKYFSFCEGFGVGYNAVLDQIYGSQEEGLSKNRPLVPECPTHYYAPIGKKDTDFEEGVLLGRDMAKKGI